MAHSSLGPFVCKFLQHCAHGLKLMEANPSYPDIVLRKGSVIQAWGCRHRLHIKDAADDHPGAAGRQNAYALCSSCCHGRPSINAIQTRCLTSIARSAISDSRLYVASPHVEIKP